MQVEAAEIIAKVAAQHDVERGGAGALKDRPGEGDVPELVASVFGERVTKDDIPVIQAFFARHFGINISSTDADKIFAVLIATGIGGQRNTTGMLSELVRLFPNRQIHLYSAFGAPFAQTTADILERLDKAHANIASPQEKLDLLKNRKEQIKLLLKAESKSGTTPETMVGFQEQVREALRLYAQFVYGREAGLAFANTMIDVLYDGENFLTDGESVDKLVPDQKMMLAIVLDRAILSTGKFSRSQQMVDGRARTGGSRLDRFVQAMAQKLESEFRELGIAGISKVTLYNRFGGRTQVLGPGAGINATMALSDGEAAPILRLTDAARPVAERHSRLNDRSLWGKRLAAFTKNLGAESMYIGLPTTIEAGVVDAIQQLVGESIDGGALVGRAAGMKAVVHSTTVLAEKSEYRQDGGKRVYLLVTDRLADEATKAAEEKIIEEQTARGNHVVRVDIKDHSPEEVVKLFYELMNFVEWYGNFTAAEVLANLENYPRIINFMCKYAAEKGYGTLTAEAIKNVDFGDSEEADRIIAVLYSERELGVEDPNYAYYMALRKVMKDINVWFQPGVEWGKTYAKKIAEGLFVQEGIQGRMVQDGVAEKEVEIPIRDETVRQQSYETQRRELQEEMGAYIVGGVVSKTVEGSYRDEPIKTIDVPGISVDPGYTLDDVLRQMEGIAQLRQEQRELVDTVVGGSYKIEQRRKRHDGLEREIEQKERELIEIASQVDCNEETAQQLARAAYVAHQEGQSVAISLYAGRQRLDGEGFFDFVRRLSMVDIAQCATDAQHTDEDGTVAGTRTAFKILAHVREKHGERVVADGMVAPYWNDLTPQDLLWINHQAYAGVYREREIDYVELRMEGSEREDVARMFVLFAQANRIYLELARLDHIIAVPASKIIADEAGFEEWINNQPEDIAVVIIATSEEYKGVKKYKNIAYVKVEVVGWDVTDDEYENILTDLFFISKGDTALFGGFKLGTAYRLDATYSLDEYKKVIDKVASDV